MRFTTHKSATTQVVAESTEFKFLLFETKFVRAFSRPQGKLVLWRYARVWRNYPHAVHNLQKPHLLQDRFESWVAKCTTSLKFRSFRNNVGKRLARCCYPFYRSKGKCYQLPPCPLCHPVRESWSDGFTPPPRVSPSRAPFLSFAYYFQAPATQATNKHIERSLLSSDYS